MDVSIISSSGTFLPSSTHSRYVLAQTEVKKDMADLQNDVVNIDERIKQIEAKIKNPEKLRMTIEKFSNSLNSLINRLEKGDLVEKDILVRNMVSNLEIDAQKRVIYRYKSPFNFIFEPEFSTGSPVGEPGGSIISLRSIRTHFVDSSCYATYHKTK